MSKAKIAGRDTGVSNIKKCTVCNSIIKRVQVIQDGKRKMRTYCECNPL